jgi:hypothetical protein
MPGERGMRKDGCKDGQDFFYHAAHTLYMPAHTCCGVISGPPSSPGGPPWPRQMSGKWALGEGW